MRKRKGALLRISIEIETTKKSLFYLLAQSVSVYPTSNVGTLVKRSIATPPSLTVICHFLSEVIAPNAQNSR